MSRFLPDLSGFDVVQLPSIEERLKLPYSDPNSIPKVDMGPFADFDWIFTGNNPSLVYKIRVFRRDVEDWRLEVPEIAQSEFGGSFRTQKEAFERALEYLDNKPQ